jgi:predicted PurR-regulated permease PerM
MELNLPYRGKGDGLIVVTLALIILISYFLWPLLDGLVLGFVFAYVGRPVRDLFGKKRRKIGSLAAIICIVAPLSAIFASGVFEVIRQIWWLENHQSQIIATSYEFVSRVHIPQVIFDELSRGMANLMGISLNLLTNLPVFGLGTTITLGFLNLLIAFCVCYFLLLDGKRLVRAMLVVLNLENSDFELRCLTRIDCILCGVYMGSIYTAIVGGITSIAIFYIFGVPRPFAMASIVFLAGMVPFLTWLVFIPTAISRYIEIGPMDALLFFIAASILVHVAELVIRPYIVYTKSSIHPLLVLLAFLGGGVVAGISGFFLAPAMVGVVTGIFQVMREMQVERKILERPGAADSGCLDPGRFDSG